MPGMAVRLMSCRIREDRGLSKCTVAGGLLVITMAGGMMYFENKDVM